MVQMECVSFALSACLSCSALSDGWLLVIVCRSVYSLGIPQHQWINGRWECSNRALRSIHQADRRCWERNTPPEFVLEIVWMFVCASLCVFVCIITSVGLCASVCLDISVYLCFCVRITGRRSVDTDKSKASTSPNAHFPSSASSRQRRQIITSLFFCLLSLYSFYSVYPKCCSGSMQD